MSNLFQKKWISNRTGNINDSRLFSVNEKPAAPWGTARFCHLYFFFFFFFPRCMWHFGLVGLQPSIDAVSVGGTSFSQNVMLRKGFLSFGFSPRKTPKNTNHLHKNYLTITINCFNYPPTRYGVLSPLPLKLKP